MGISLTVLIVAATVLVSWLAFNNPRLADRLILWPPAIDRQHQYDRPVTHGFIHADFQHLLFNMITLYFFGRAVETWFVPYIGRVGFVVIWAAVAAVVVTELGFAVHTRRGVVRAMLWLARLMRHARQ